MSEDEQALCEDLAKIAKYIVFDHQGSDSSRERTLYEMVQEYIDRYYDLKPDEKL